MVHEVVLLQKPLNTVINLRDKEESEDVMIDGNDVRLPDGSWINSNGIRSQYASWLKDDLANALCQMLENAIRPEPFEALSKWAQQQKGFQEYYWIAFAVVVAAQRRETFPNELIATLKKDPDLEHDFFFKQLQAA